MPVLPGIENGFTGPEQFEGFFVHLGGRVPNPTLQFGDIQNMVADYDAQKQTPFTGKWGKIISGDTLDSVSWHGMGY